jgi:hypothetical protein
MVSVKGINPKTDVFLNLQAYFFCMTTTKHHHAKRIDLDITAIAKITTPAS